MRIPGDNLKAGWGVLRLKPWDLAGVFEVSVDAEALADRLGGDYVVKYGDHEPNTQTFRFSSEAGSLM